MAGRKAHTIYDLHRKKKEEDIKQQNNQPVVQLYHPHQGQQEIHKYICNPNQKEVSKTIFLCCSRRWGKSYFALNQALYDALNVPNNKIGFLTPTYKLASELFNLLYAALGDSFPYYLSKAKGANSSSLKFRFNNGSSIEFHSFISQPENLRGLTFTELYIDEFCLMDKDVYDAIVRPITLTCTRVVMMSTPRGKSHFSHKIYLWGLKSEYKNYKSFHFDIYSNPLIPKSEVELIKESIPELIFRQEILAEWIEDDLTALFKNVDEVTVNIDNLPVKRMYAGFDVGLVDSSVLSISDEDNNVKYIYRFNNTTHQDQTYELIVEQVIQKLKYHNVVSCIVELNGVGKPVFDMLKSSAQRNGCRTQLIDWFQKNKNKNKNNIIEHLIILFQNKQIKISNDIECLDQLRLELKNFGMEFNPKTRTIRYCAKRGHDDIIMSLAMCMEAVKQKSSNTLSYSVINMPNRNRY
ncbi:terminase family protein [Dysgonomonas alginatilytica]|uniref:Terminase family protein n=1 Tax=Dysgonomonas alginatilytica TaxID=1605892 RepID=A0A2V3PJP8_9BACT|nr:terminase family protein [Dysgonomonas alginatilytica]PXV58798.1 terminase family protein [Dysgonomonas alginatilytica]